MPIEEEGLESLEWDIADRDERLRTGELLEDVDDPTVVVVEADE